MTTKISLLNEADAWCRRLGNFEPIAFGSTDSFAATSHRAASSAGSRRASMHGAPRWSAARGEIGLNVVFLVLVVAAVLYPLSLMAN